MTKGYIFDYGGTLDTGGCHWGRLIGHAYEQCGVGIDNQLFREAYVYAERELAKQPIIQPHYSFRQTLATKLQIELEYIHRCHPELHVKDKHEALLNTLYATTQKETARSKRVLEQLKVNYPLVLVSNFYGNIHTVLREYGMDHLFDNVIESAVVGIRKPDARIFALTAGLPVIFEGLVGAHGHVYGLESFGFSAPYKVLDEKLGYTAENIRKEVLAFLK